MIREKMQQAAAILREKGLDLWMVFGRESHTAKDPCADMVVGTGYTWQSAFLIHCSGRTVAIVGSLDAAEVEKRGDYGQVLGYVGGIRDTLVGLLDELQPKSIAVNWSLDDVMADGLTHGMYLQLEKIMEGTPYFGRLCSAEGVVSALRGRKSSEELRRIRRAVEETDALYEELCRHLKPGMTEKEVAAKLAGLAAAKGYEPAWSPEHCPSVFTGVPREGQAHTGPTDRRIERGDVLNMDFGLKIDGYCSDLQRTWYVCREGETEAPPEVRKGFQTVADSIAAAAAAAKPGTAGWVVDDVARQLIVSRGYPEYPHALGHQVGRSAHDGGVLLCPQWERYGKVPWQTIEEGQVFTLEPRLPIEGFGVATVEEMAVIGPAGAEFISKVQKEIWLVR